MKFNEKDVREKNITDERVASLYMDAENGKATFKKVVKIVGYILLAIAAICLVTFFAHLAFPDIEWLWNRS